MDRSIAIVCPGQGSQRSGMLEALPQSETVERLLDAAEALSGLELRAIERLGSAEDLADTRVAQPLLYLADWAWATELLERGLRPVALAGHSLGELAALAVGGAFSVEAGLELVIERSRLMAITAADTPGGMAAVIGMDGTLVADAVVDLAGVWVANDNAPGQVVISGTHEGLEAATRALTEAGARKIVPLDVSGPFHSPLMEPARAAFETVLARTAFSETAVAVVQNADPTPTTDPEALRARLAAQITAPVRWTETMAALGSLGADMLVEAGPGAVLAGLARRVDGLEAVSVGSASLEELVREAS